MAYRWNGGLDGLASMASDRRWLWMQAFVLVVASASLAFALRPEPFSDWLYYWVAASDLDRYERGGAMLLLVSMLRPLGWSAHATMLALNVPAALSILFMSRRIDPTPGKWLAHIVAGYLLLLTPYFGLVQLDLLAAACLAAAWVLLMGAPERGMGRWRKVLAVLAGAAAVSTRPQFLLVLSTLSLLMALVWGVTRGNGRRDIPGLMALLMLGVLSGFLLDSGLRAGAERSAALRTNSSVTLYSGLLASSTSYPECGQWSEEATATMRSDLGKPLSRAVLDRLGNRPVSHWGAIMACKARQIVMPPAFAWWWLHASPRVGAHMQEGLPTASPDLARLVTFGEAWSYRLMTLVIYLYAILTLVRYVRVDALAWLPVAWIGAFWCVHLVFEVQGRYFLSTLLLVPLLCAWVMRRRSPALHGTAG